MYVPCEAFGMIFLDIGLECANELDKRAHPLHLGAIRLFEILKYSIAVELGTAEYVPDVVLRLWSVRHPAHNSNTFAQEGKLILLRALSVLVADLVDFADALLEL